VFFVTRDLHASSGLFGFRHRESLRTAMGGGLSIIGAPPPARVVPVGSVPVSHLVRLRSNRRPGGRYSLHALSLLA